MFKIDLSVLEPKWYRYPEEETEYDDPHCELQIRIYPDGMKNSTLRRGPDGQPEMVFTGEEKKRAFIHCLLGVKNLADAEGKPIDKLTDKIKGDLFDAESVLKTGIPEFVLSQSGAISSLLGERTKN